MQFYILKNPKASESSALTDYLTAKPDNVGAAPRCNLCNRVTGPLPWLPPFRAEIEVWGDKFGDIAFGGSELLVSKRFKELYLDAKLSGLEGFQPVDIVKVNSHRKVMKEQLPAYFCVTVLRSRAAIDEARSGLERERSDGNDGREKCPECRTGGIIKRAGRVVIEDGTWGGEDIFIARGLAKFITSQRFKEVCDDGGVLNANLIPAEQYSFDYYPWERRNQ